MRVQREIEIEAPVEDVWEALATDEGRDRWLDADAGVLVEHVDPPSRLVWWWSEGEASEALTRVEITIVAIPAGSRVVVVETDAAFPLTALAAALCRVPA